MQRLVGNAGKIRTKGVGIVKGKEIAHVAPPAHLVEDQLKDLFDYAKKDMDLLLIRTQGLKNLSLKYYKYPWCIKI